MAVIDPGAFIQGATHDARDARQLLAALSGEAVETFANTIGAVGPGHGLTFPVAALVTQRAAGVNMSVDVAAFRALITGSSSLAQGVYPFTNDAVENLPIATSDATNPRLDIVVAQIRDNTEDAGGSDAPRLFVVTGTPASAPTDPAIPAGSLALARVAVAASVTSITDANITMVAGLAPGSAWNQAWGLVAAPATVTSAQSPITTLTDLTGLTRTFTAVAGRRYRTTLDIAITAGLAGQLAAVYIRDGASSTLKIRQFYVPEASTSYGFHFDYVWTGSGSVTHKASMARAAGSNSVGLGAGGDAPATLTIEDIGPV